MAEDRAANVKAFRAHNLSHVPRQRRAERGDLHKIHARTVRISMLNLKRERSPGENFSHNLYEFLYELEHFSEIL